MRFRTRWRLKIGDIGNILMVLIQLGTVWILWLTYKNTVIPTRQKELLSEQLAQLEMTREKTLNQIDVMKKRLGELAQQSAEQVSEVGKLRDDKRRLSGDVDTMRQEETKATRAAHKARETLVSTKRQLTRAQLDIFHDRALIQIYRPSFTDRVNEINGSTAAGQETISDEIQAAQKAWPTFDLTSKGVGAQLAGLRSPLFPNSFGPEFAKIFLASMAGFNCKMPDFANIERNYAQQLKAANTNAEQEVEKREAKIIADGKREGIRYIIDPKSHEVSVSAQRNMNKIGVQLSLDNELFDLRNACYETYNKKGGAVLNKYVEDVQG